MLIFLEHCVWILLLLLRFMSVVSQDVMLCAALRQHPAQISALGPPAHSALLSAAGAVVENRYFCRRVLFLLNDIVKGKFVAQGEVRMIVNPFGFFRLKQTVRNYIFQRFFGCIGIHYLQYDLGIHAGNQVPKYQMYF